MFCDREILTSQKLLSKVLTQESEWNLVLKNSIIAMPKNVYMKD